MSKKLKKLLLFSAVVGSAVGAVCYFSKKKNAVQEEPEEDYDDFSVDLESDSSGSGSYVPLTPEPSCDVCSEEEPKEDEVFTPLAEQVAQSAEKAEEAVEEFFDEEDTPGAEQPANN